MIPSLLGGIGLFLLGMILLTDGVKAAAGEALRGWLTRLTGGPSRALGAGLAATAVVQSSSATILTTIGFVSAGLLTFPQAVGVVLGANLGTTSTGWLVSLLGFKLDITAVSLPLVGTGALLRLFTRDRAAALGLSVAGFGLIFVGIDVLQDGMAGLAARIDLSSWTGSGLLARLGLVGIGALMTVVMQSSSAAMATTLAAVHAGAIDLHDGAPLVIGQNLGTTVTAALAAIGASVAARRTAVAHILFNVLTGLVALALLPLFLRLSVGLADSLEHGAGAADATVALAAFHTAFNLAGVLMVLPLANPFARAVSRLVPSRGPALTAHLDDSVLRLPEVAVEAVRRAVAGTAGLLCRHAAELCEERGPGRQARAAAARSFEEARILVEGALADARRFLGRVETPSDSGALYHRHVSVLHALDHLDRLSERLAMLSRVRPAEPGTLPEIVSHLPPVLRDAARRLALDPPGPGSAAALERASRSLAAVRREQRRDTLEQTALGDIEPERALRRLRQMRLLDAVVYHAWRAAAHVEGAAPGNTAPEGAGPPYERPLEEGPVAPGRSGMADGE